jgi:hypothetical protein
MIPFFRLDSEIKNHYSTPNGSSVMQAEKV